MFAVHGTIARPTRDVDFSMRYFSNDFDSITAVFAAVCRIELDDALQFLPESIRCVQILAEEEYTGVRVILTCSMGKARYPVQIDIGVGDVLVSPVIIDYPVLLEDSPHPRIYASSFETVIAEKFDAMLGHSDVNSRMKDFYDVVMLADDIEFDGATLLQAIRLTNKARGTETVALPPVFQREFYVVDLKTRQWTSFLQRSNMEAESFPEIGEKISAFLWPVYAALLNGSSFEGKWDRKLFKWISDGK